MNTVRHVLEVKGKDIWDITPEATVFDALRLMADKDVGSLLVMEGGKLAGILTEREYARQVILHGRTSKETRVREIMSTDLYPIHPEQTMEECMDVMTHKHVRYLPVMEDGELLGVISIGDVVSSIIHRQRQTIKSLEDRMTKKPG